MKRIEIKRFKSDKLTEQEILERCETDESGFIIYPGPYSIRERTGSPVMQLIEWYLYQTGEKPLDADLFQSFLNGDLD